MIILSHQQDITYAKCVNKVTQRGNAEEEKRKAGRMESDGVGKELQS